MDDQQPPESAITTKDAIIKQVGYHFYSKLTILHIHTLTLPTLKQACQFCQLRIQGTRDPSDYLALIQRPSHHHHHHHHCPLCFDIFSTLLTSSSLHPINSGTSQHSGIIPAIQTVLNGWRLTPPPSSPPDTDVTATTTTPTKIPVALDIFLPASLAIRSHAFTILPSSVETKSNNTIGIKEAVKLVTNAVLCSSSSNSSTNETTPRLEIVGDAPLKLLLTIEHAESSNEASWLVKDPKPSRKRRFEWKKQNNKKHTPGGNNNNNNTSNGPGSRGEKEGEEQYPVVDTDHQQSLHRQPSFATASAMLLARLSSMSSSSFQQQCPSTATHLSPSHTPVQLSLYMSRKPVYLGGRYYKVIRNIPQSPWFLGGERKGESSVSEEIEKVVLSTLHVGETVTGGGGGGGGGIINSTINNGTSNYSNFLSAGREDIDVRMLGSGRPFALELKDTRLWPPTTDECSLMEAAINQSNSGVEVSNLRIFTADDIKLLKHGESDKAKRYAAVCWLPHRPISDADIAAINSAGKVVVKQWTPVRVLHRRANLERERVVDELYAEKIEGQEQYFVLKMRTAAGTYVKEFVHGDFKRTQPSLGDLLSLEGGRGGEEGGGGGGRDRVEIISLDVLGIDMEGL